MPLYISGFIFAKAIVTESFFGANGSRFVTFRFLLVNTTKLRIMPTTSKYPPWKIIYGGRADCFGGFLTAAKVMKTF